MHGMRSKGALPTGARIVEYDQFANVSPGDPSCINCGMSVSRDWGRFRLQRSMVLALIVLAVVLPGASGLAATDASTEAQDPPQTTTIQRSAPTESELAPDWNSQEPSNWTIYLVTLAVVAAVSFVVGRSSVRSAPPKVDLLNDVNVVFDRQSKLGQAYHFEHLDPVLIEAKDAVIAALRKRKLLLKRSGVSGANERIRRRTAPPVKPRAESPAWHCCSRCAGGPAG